MKSAWVYLVLFSPLVAIAVFGAIWLVMMRHLGRRARAASAVTQLEGAGIATTAEVLEIHDTGLRKHRIFSRVRLSLAVRGTDQFPAFEAETLAAISPIQAPVFARGRIIRVKVDALNHARVVIDEPVR